MLRYANTASQRITDHLTDAGKGSKSNITSKNIHSQTAYALDCSSVYLIHHVLSISVKTEEKGKRNPAVVLENF